MPDNATSQTFPTYLPLYEAKMIHHFDHRFATYERDGTIRDTTLEEHQDPMFAPLPRYWVEEGEVKERLVRRDRDGNVTWRWEQPWLLGLRKTARSTDIRTAISTLAPVSAVNDKLPLVIFDTQDADLAVLFTVIYSSLALDYVLRQSLGGTDVGHYVLAQLPLPRPEDIPDELRKPMIRIGRELVLTDLAMTSVLSPSNQPASWELLSRTECRHQLDALCLLLYGLDADDASYVIDTFEVLRTRELGEYSSFLTKNGVSAAFANLN